MNGAMAHRGPDDQGTEFIDLGGGGMMGLGFRRLAFQDLSSAGHQPMVHPTTGDILIFNGEIYNFQEIRGRLEALGVKFRGRSDSEVLLHALVEWGTDAIAGFSGMFAFAFFHKRTRRLLISRGPIGIKPLYLSHTSDRLIIASEVQGVLASGVIEKRIDRRGVAGLLAYGAVQEPFTLYEGIQSLPAGTYQWFDLAGDGSAKAGTPMKHWEYPSIDDSITEPIARERVDHELTRAVREHLISDVPVGVFLSSGVDSTVMAGLARQVSPHVRTFTLGFLDQPDLSESDLARTSARELHVEHHDIQVTSANALALTQRWLDTLDQPSVDGLNTYIISKAVRDAGIVAAISGLGGDELFGGYPSFSELPRILRFLRRVQWMSPSARGQVMHALGMTKADTVRVKMREMGEVGPDLLRLYLLRRRTKPNERLVALGLDWRQLGLDESYQHPKIVERIRMSDDDPVAAISRYESEFYMKCMLLRDTDATSMAHSLEIRVPFLDRRVLDLAYSIPGRVRLPGAKADKHILRTAFNRFLRPELLGQEKRGFTLPIRRWMTTSLRDLCEESINSFRRSGIVEGDEVNRTWEAFLKNPEERIWSSAFLMCVVGHYISRSHQAPAVPSPASLPAQ